MGGATCAAGLAPSGAEILILERGERLLDSPQTRDARAIFQRGVFRPQETWIDGAGEPFNPGNYYYVGGNTKLYGAVLIRYRAQDFRPIQYADGVTPGWPFDYDEFEPWYARAEALYQVRGALGQDPTEPRHSTPYPHAPVPDEPAIAAARARMARSACIRSRCRSASTSTNGSRAPRRPGTRSPTPDTGKMDAETCGLEAALAHPNVDAANRRARRATADGGRRQARQGRGISGRGRNARRRRQARRARRRRGQFGGAAAALFRARPRQSLATWSVAIS